MAFNTGHRVNHDACHRLLLSLPRRLIVCRRWYCWRHGPHAVTNGASDPMDHGCASHNGGESQPDLAGGHVCTKAWNRGQPVIERRTGIPETMGGATQTSMTSLHR